MHQVLSGALVDQPEALVVDMAEVDVRDRLALSVFAATARRAESGRACRCCSAPVADRRAMAGRVDHVSGGPDLDRLCRGDSGGRRGIHAADPGAVRAGGRACRRAGSWSPTRARDGTCRRGRPGRVGAQRAGRQRGAARRHADAGDGDAAPAYLHLAVVDGSSAQARPGGTDLRAEGGRGLMLVRELTQRWGSVPAGQGKAVWAMLPAT
ncbi:ATP-binding protein [Micromonospora sp. M12]